MAQRFGALRNVLGCFGYDRHTADSETTGVVAALYSSNVANPARKRSRPLRATITYASAVFPDGGKPAGVRRMARRCQDASNIPNGRASKRLPPKLNGSASCPP